MNFVGQSSQYAFVLHFSRYHSFVFNEDNFFFVDMIFLIGDLRAKTWFSFAILPRFRKHTGSGLQITYRLLTFLMSKEEIS